MFKKVFAIVAVLLVMPFAFAQAATLTLDPANSEYGLGDSFEMTIRIDIDNCVNAVEGYISFPNDILRFSDFSAGQSVMSLWIKQPNKSDAITINQEGKVYFSGGMPGGYCGKIPGDPGDSNILGKVIFTVASIGVDLNAPKQAKLIFLPETAVYLNDGQGTKDQLVTKEASLVVTGKQSLVKSDWENEISADKLKPEPFVVELNKDNSIADGKYFIMFSTTDKQTGVDHYEVLEIRPGDAVGEQPKRSIFDILLRRESVVPNWQVVALPYILHDQSLKSVIRVKAVDKAGNERVVEYIPPVENQVNISRNGLNKMQYTVLFGIILLVVIVFLAWLGIRRKRS